MINEGQKPSLLKRITEELKKTSLPTHGSIRLVLQDGKLIRKIVESSENIKN